MWKKVIVSGMAVALLTLIGEIAYAQQAASTFNEFAGNVERRLIRLEERIDSVDRRLIRLEEGQEALKQRVDDLREDMRFYLQTIIGALAFLILSQIAQWLVSCGRGSSRQRVVWRSI